MANVVVDIFEFVEVYEQHGDATLECAAAL